MFTTPSNPSFELNDDVSFTPRNTLLPTVQSKNVRIPTPKSDRNHERELSAKMHDLSIDQDRRLKNEFLEETAEFLAPPSIAEEIKDEPKRDRRSKKSSTDDRRVFLAKAKKI